MMHRRFFNVILLAMVLTNFSVFLIGMLFFPEADTSLVFMAGAIAMVPVGLLVQRRLRRRERKHEV